MRGCGTPHNLETDLSTYLFICLELHFLFVYIYIQTASVDAGEGCRVVKAFMCSLELRPSLGLTWSKGVQGLGSLQ